MEAEIQSNPELHNEMAIDKLIENYPNAVLKTLGASNLMSRPRGNPRLSIPAAIHDEIRLKNRLRRQWQITRNPLREQRPTPAEVGDPKTQRVEDRPV
jgi:hypothetical protein